MTYSTDTRTIRAGQVYVAIRGARYDGHDFVDEAIAKGAEAVVAEQSVAAPAHVRVIRVRSSEQYLAQQARRKLRAARPCVIAITGSVGKTSTKNAVATILRGRFPVLSTMGNLNTVLGVSLTLLNSDFGRDSAVVLEMGACRPGDITELCEYFQPDIAVVTNVHGVHLDTFGSIEGVAAAKSELVQALSASGTACLNEDDSRVGAMASRCAGRILRYGTGARCEITPSLITQTIPLLGDHAIYLVLAAFAVGHALGMKRGEINERIVHLRPEKGRLSRLPGVCGSTLIDDSYNASPAAVSGALRVLQREPAERRIACLGDMLELGPQSHALHKEVIEAAARVADHILLVGERMTAAGRALAASGTMSTAVVYEHSRAAARALRAGHPLRPAGGDVFLVKGSQGVRMERISRVLLRADIAPERVLCRQSESWRQI